MTLLESSPKEMENGFRFEALPPYRDDAVLVEGFTRCPQQLLPPGVTYLDIGNENEALAAHRIRQITVKTLGRLGVDDPMEFSEAFSEQASNVRHCAPDDTGCLGYWFLTASQREGMVTIYTVNANPCPWEYTDAKFPLLSETYDGNVDELPEGQRGLYLIAAAAADYGRWALPDGRQVLWFSLDQKADPHKVGRSASQGAPAFFAPHNRQAPLQIVQQARNDRTVMRWSIGGNTEPLS